MTEINLGECFVTWGETDLGLALVLLMIEPIEDDSSFTMAAVSIQARVRCRVPLQIGLGGKGALGRLKINAQRVDGRRDGSRYVLFFRAFLSGRKTDGFRAEFTDKLTFKATRSRPGGRLCRVVGANWS